MDKRLFTVPFILSHIPSIAFDHKIQNKSLDSPPFSLHSLVTSRNLVPRDVCLLTSSSQLRTLLSF